MKGLCLACLLLAILNACAGEVSAGDAPPLAADPVSPRYLVLPADMGIGHLVPSGTPHYAYGWFGVPPRKTSWTRHFGHYRNYTQWKVK
jgi:hypothetical protein